MLYLYNSLIALMNINIIDYEVITVICMPYAIDYNSKPIGKPIGKHLYIYRIP